MLLLEADGSGRHASVGVAIGGIAARSRPMFWSGTSKDAAVLLEEADIMSAVVSPARCFPAAPVVGSDLMKLCLKKLDSGFEAPPRLDAGTALLLIAGVDGDSPVLNAVASLVAAVADAELAAAEVL